MVFDRQGHCLTTNKSGLSLLGCGGKEIASRKFEEIWSEKSRPAAARAVQRVLEGVPCSLDAEYVRSDGDLMAWNVGLSPVYNENREIFGFLAVSTDITAHSNAQREVEALKRQIEFILGATKTGLDIIDSTFNLRYIDPEWAKKYGDPTGRKCYEYFMDRIDVCPDCAIPRALETKQTTVSEQILIKEDNRPIQVVTIPFQDHLGEWLLAEVKTDITELKKVEEELMGHREHLKKLVDERTSELKKSNALLREEISERLRAELSLKESEKKYRALIDEAGDAIFLTDREGNFLEVNRKAVEMTGYSKKELLRMNFTELHPRGEVGKISAAFQEGLLRGSGFLNDIPILRKDGRIVAADLNGSVIRYGEETIIQAIIRDITERKQAEEALRMSEARYRAVVEDQTELVCRFLPDGTLTFVNDAYCRYFKRSREELIGERFSPPIPKDDLEKTKQQTTSLSPANPAVTCDHRVILPGGEIRWQHRTQRAIYDAEETLMEFQVVARDITDYRKMEEELAKAEKLESIGILAGGIAHDFNNLLMGILGHISIARFKTNSRSEVHAILTAAERTTMSAKKLTQQLLTFSKGGMPVKKATSIKEIVKDQSNFALNGSGIKCEISIPDDIWKVDIDEAQMTQVFNNLFINAVQAMSGVGEIEVTGQNVSLEAGVPPLKEGSYVRITVRDQGIGISEEHLSKIFDPFFTTKQTGSGLGLSTTYSVIRKHNGHIFAESELGSGAAFHIYLPASQENISPGPDPQQTRLFPGGRVLVMEDDAEVRYALAGMIRECGYDADCAGDGVEAAELYRKAAESGRCYDAVILDLIIKGGVGGLEAVKMLIEIDPGVRAIVSSGYTDNEVMAEHKKYGFRNALPKPYENSSLCMILQEVITGAGDLGPPRK